MPPARTFNTVAAPDVSLTFVAGRHIGFEQTIPVFLGQTGAVVCDVDHSDFARDTNPRENSAFSEFAVRRTADCLDRILEKIGQRLRNQTTVELRQDRSARKFAFEGNLRIAHAHQKDGLPHRFREILRFDNRFGHACKRRELVHHSSDVPDLADDCVGALLEYVTILGESFAEFAAQPFGR
jgi:hypothetical protein